MYSCPICNHNQYDQLLSLPCGNLDKSALYDTVVIVCCSACGHVSNLLSEEDKIGIRKYYEEEYSPSNIGSPNKEGDIPGSSSQNSMNRYSSLFDFIKPYLLETSKILDIGCAMGGLLCFLKEKKYTELYGIDFSSLYVEVAQKNKGLQIKKGSAEQIPFENNMFDLLVADQVVEHLFDPNDIFLEAKRLLKKNGYFCISVPNAQLYAENYFFDFYWFLMREHVQHFDAYHLVALAKKHGFSLENISYTFPVFLSKEATLLPNMSIMFKLNSSTRIEEDESGFSLKSKIQKYIQQSYEQLEVRRIAIDKLYNDNTPLYIWGMSREFLYLYSNTNLNKCNIVGLIDDIPTKQLCTIDERKIHSSKIIQTLPENSAILIAAFAHKKLLTAKANQLGFKGRII